MEQGNKGANIFKISSVLMVVSGVISIIAAIVFLIGLSGLVALFGETLPVWFYVSALLSMVGAVSSLVAGIMGLKACKGRAKVITCMIWGIVVAVLSTGGFISNVVTGGDISVSSLILGLVIPILYLVGANMFKKSASLPA